MTRRDDELLREQFQQLPDIPFSEHLQQQILSEVLRQPSSVPTPARARRSAFRALWKPWAAAVLGVAAAAVVLVAVMANPASTARTTTATAPLHAYGLQASALKVVNVHVGTVNGYPPNSSVVATVKNTGTKPIGKTDVVGVLAFPRTVAQSSLLQSDSLTFVNGPSQPLAPGAKTVWAFHPVGVPHDMNTAALTEQPYLVFYKNNLLKNPHAQAAVRQNTVTDTTASSVPRTEVWRKSSLVVEQVKVTAKSQWQTGQAVTVHVLVKNTGKTRLNISKLWAVTWYNTEPGTNTKVWDWARPNNVRFLNQLSSASANIAPGQQLEVYFGIVGSSQMNLLERPPHVTIIQG